jgi:transmembrane E3 ubiquitin-protein ligase
MPQPQQSSAGLVIFILLVWMIMPDGEYRAQSLMLSDLAEERLARFQTALDLLNGTRWGDFSPRTEAGDKDHIRPRYLNLTGFREEDGFAWQDLDLFRTRGHELNQYAMPPGGAHDLWNLGQPGSVWSNASGTLNGEWVRKPGSVYRGYDSYNLTESVPSSGWIHDQTNWARNITGDSGRMVMMLESNKSITEYEQLPSDDGHMSGGQIRTVKSTLTVEDTTGSGHSWEMRLWGTHWPQKGVLLLTTTSEKFEGIFGLPHLSPGADYFQSSQMLLNQTLQRTIDKKRKDIFIDQTMPWCSDIDNPLYTKFPSPNCEMVVFAQIHPPTRHDMGLEGVDQETRPMGDVIHAIESELEYPMGAPIPAVPNLQMSAVAYSPDCGFFLETKGPPEFPPGEAQHLAGMKKEIHIHQVKSWLLRYAMVIFAQVYLLKSQLAESNTPSTTARVSFGTVSMLVLVDGMTFTASATWVSSATSTFLPTLVVMFASFLSMTLGGSFLAKIHEVQLPEGRRRDRDREQPGSGSSTNTPTPAPAPVASTRQDHTGSLLPGPVTAGRPVQQPPPQPIIIPSDQDIDAEIAEVANAASAVPQTGGGGQQQPTRAEASQSFQSIVGRYVLLSLGISFLAISSTTWYSGYRSAFLNLCAFCYLSLWIPQIYRNIMRNCRRALRWQFVVGQSILRLLPIAYFWIKPDNFLYARNEPRAFLALCVWLWMQVVVLAAQDIVGPRFGVPTSWTPEAWDYHPVLKEDNLEAGGLPIGLLADDQPASEGNKASGSNTRAIDCAICTETLEVPVVKSGEDAGSVAGAFARRMYMVTPCRHIFHTTCLESWMKFRLACPICREELPAL